ncbi:MAG: hypothetical protein JSS00_07615 [Proteobacteria bacterium]|nr:hypothetical protein [Pseudomonadota bacterium]
MRWVDCCSYVGPDRRVVPPGLRIRERRRKNLADQPPPLDRELRHLRLMVLDAYGARGVTLFAQRTAAIALLAEAGGEPGIGDILTGLSESLLRRWDDDPRPFIYEQLDRLHGAKRLN